MTSIIKSLLLEINSQINAIKYRTRDIDGSEWDIELLDDSVQIKYLCLLKKKKDIENLRLFGEITFINEQIAMQTAINFAKQVAKENQVVREEGGI
jgi:transcriptional antiterminator